MGKMDVRTRAYVRGNEVFADICNYMLYQGKQVICADQLREKDPVELILPLKDENVPIPIQRFRDLLKQVIIKQSAEATFLIVGIENQLEVHYAMTVQNMLYDAIDYASQVSEIAKKNRKDKNYKNVREFLSGMRKDDKILPVVTIVIYWGSDDWDGARCLHDMFDAAPDILKFVPDYKMNLIAPSEIEDFDAFHTEFGLIMECLKKSADRQAMKQMLEEKGDRFSRMQQESAALLADLTKIRIDVDYEKGKVVDMCKAIEEMVEEGRTEGREEGNIKKIRNNMELPIETIAAFMRVDEDYVRDVMNEIAGHPQEDDGQIARRMLKLS